MQLTLHTYVGKETVPRTYILYIESGGHHVGIYTWANSSLLKLGYSGKNCSCYLQIVLLQGVSSLFTCFFSPNQYIILSTR